MKVGLIRCEIVADFCPAASCLKAMKEKTGAFEGVEEEIELVGVMTCGGCPGKKVSSKVRTLVNRGADTIVLSSCISRGYPVGEAFPCPNAEEIKKAVVATAKKCGKAKGIEIRIVEWTH